MIVKTHLKIKKRIFTVSKEHNKNHDTHFDAFVDDYINNKNFEVNYLSNESNQNDSTYINNTSCWILDSGASIHITNNVKQLHDVTKCNESIKLPNGKSILSKCKGNFTGLINNNKITLTNVYFAPDIRKNLISISSLLNNNFKVVFSNIKNIPFALIYNEHGKRIYKADADGSNTYKIYLTTHPNIPSYKIPIISHVTNDDFLWHRRLCHFNFNKIKHALSKIKTTNKCQTCSNSKLRNEPYHSSSNKTPSILDLIHLDLIGPIDESIYGNKYILTIMDDFSRYGWVIFLPNKYETFNSFHQWNLKSEKHTKLQYQTYQV